MLATLTGHKDMVMQVIYSGDGKRLVSASSDGTLKVWGTRLRAKDLTTLKGHKNGVNHV